MPRYANPQVPGEVPDESDCVEVKCEERPARGSKFLEDPNPRAHGSSKFLDEPTGLRLWANSPKTGGDLFTRTDSKRSTATFEGDGRGGCVSRSTSHTPPVWNGERGPRTSSKFRILEAADRQSAIVQLAEFQDSKRNRIRVMLRFITGQIQKYSVPLILGVLTALVWKNVDDASYHGFIDGAIIEGASVFGADLHGLSLHFIVNDIFMCFFFGLAIKEVTEALLPGGSLYPLKYAVNPLLATLGGVVGPVLMYILAVLVLFAAGVFEGQMCVGIADTGAQRRLGGGGAAVAYGPPEPCSLGPLLKGCGVPTATDISLAWMFALIIFGVGHPAINFLLLLAIVDDALGMVMIAVFYPDPANPVKPAWLGLVAAGMVLAFVMRKLKVPSWPLFIAISGPFTWFGLFKSHVHPALALVFVVPFMPATHAIEALPGERDLGACDLGPKRPPGAHLPVIKVQGEESPKLGKSATMKKMKTAIFSMVGVNEEEAPLHLFEHQLKLPVDLGMFFFGLANAGVRLGSVGGITGSVFFALLIGKTLGIACFSLLGTCMGFGLPDGLSVADLFALSAIAGVGLTVALFVANEAFVDPELQAQAKMGAVFSVACGGVGWAIQRLTRGREPVEE